MPNKLPDFFIIPAQILTENDFQKLDGFVYGLIYWYSKLKLKKCILSNKKIGKLLNCHDRSVSRSLKRLSEKGLIDIKYSSKDKTERIELVPLIAFFKGGTPTGEGGVNPQVKGGTPTGYHNKKSLIRTNKDIKEISKKILNEYNNVFRTGEKKKRLSSTHGFENNLEFWLDQYSFEDIVKALKIAYKDPYWRDVMTPSLLLRKQKAKSGEGSIENADRIGDLLVREDIFNFDFEQKKFTEEAVHALAVSINIPLPWVHKRGKMIMEMVENGEFQKRNQKITLLQALEKWIKADLSKGWVQHCNELEVIDLQMDDPKRRKK